MIIYKLGPVIQQSSKVNHTETILAQVALRAPPEVAFTIHSWPLLLPSFSLSLSPLFSRGTRLYVWLFSIRS